VQESNWENSDLHNYKAHQAILSMNFHQVEARVKEGLIMGLIHEDDQDLPRPKSSATNHSSQEVLYDSNDLYHSL
jgi:hypothetical protein